MLAAARFKAAWRGESGHRREARSLGEGAGDFGAETRRGVEGAEGLGGIGGGIFPLPLW